MDVREYIYDLIANSKKPISRLRLTKLTSLSDRKVREHIADLRLDGLPICSKKGYFIPSTTVDAKIFIANMKAKVKSLSKMIKAVERSTIIKLGNQRNYLKEGKK